LVCCRCCGGGGGPKFKDVDDATDDGRADEIV